MRIYYTYAWLRVDGTPYYIGKGCGKRCFVRGGRSISPPSDPSRIIILKKSLTEGEAFRHEKYLIFVFGRVDLGTGILHNRTDGGDGTSGYVRSPELRERDRQLKLDNSPNRGKKFWFNLELQKEKFSLYCPGPGWSLGRLPSVRHALQEIRRKQEEGLLTHPRKGKSHSETSKQKIRESKLGGKMSAETKEKMSVSRSKEGNPRYGGKFNWWVNREGQTRSLPADAPHPGPEWQRGRKWK
jgi:hypothetical protein